MIFPLSNPYYFLTLFPDQLAVPSDPFIWVKLKLSCSNSVKFLNFLKNFNRATNDLKSF